MNRRGRKSDLEGKAGSAVAPVARYLEFVMEALMAAHASVVKGRKDGNAAAPMGRGASGDLTFRVDKDAEDAVLSVSEKYFESPTVISEERGVVHGKEKLWILLDPIDGSSNAKRDTGLYSTAICVGTKNEFRSIVAAGVIDHTCGRLVWGDSQSVYENWSIAVPSTERNLRSALVSVDSKFYMMSDKGLSKITKFMASTKYPRIFSTAALETAYVATGRVDAYVSLEGGLRTFDCMPSLFLLKTAGCPFTIPQEKLDRIPLDSKERMNYIAASNAFLLEEIKRSLE